MDHEDEGEKKESRPHERRADRVSEKEKREGDSSEVNSSCTLTAWFMLIRNDEYGMQMDSGEDYRMSEP